MKTFIVPTDFSDTSKNAARYAARLAGQVPGSRIILYNVFDRIDTESSDGSVVYNDHEASQKIMELALASVRSDMNSIDPMFRLPAWRKKEVHLLTVSKNLRSTRKPTWLLWVLPGQPAWPRFL